MSATRRTVVITGAEGFVGKWLQKELQQAWPEAEIVSWDLPRIDITKPETYEKSLRGRKLDWLVHLAGLPGVGSSWQQADTVRRVNTEATTLLLEQVVRLSPKTKVLAVSSADIYGVGSPTPLKELPLDQARPSSPYAQSKWEMERIIEQHFKTQVMRVRSFPHLGPGQRTGFVAADFAAQIATIEKNAASRFAPSELRGMPSAAAQAVIKVGNLDAQRDFTDVRDVVRAYRMLLEKGQLGEVYHVSSGYAVSIRTVLEQLLRLATVLIAVEQDPARMRPSDIPILIGDASKLRRATGWQPQIPLERTLRDVLDDWRQRVREKS